LETYSKTHTDGSFLMELFVWLLGVVAREIPSVRLAHVKE